LQEHIANKREILKDFREIINDKLEAGMEYAGELLAGASQRLAKDALSENSRGFESVEELINYSVSSWGYEKFPSQMWGNLGSHDRSIEPAEVTDTRGILSLPEDELVRYGAKVDLLRANLAEYDGDQEAAIWFLDLAQTGFLEEGNLNSFAETSGKMAKIARKLHFIELAESAHRNAIKGYLERQALVNVELIDMGKLNPTRASEHSLDSFFEYRRLARTLGTAAAIQEFGVGRLKTLREEIAEVYPVNSSSAIYGVLALMQAEHELSKWTYFGGRHEDRAKHYGFICSAADMSGLGRVMIRRQKKPTPSVNTVQGWAKVFAKAAPDGIIGGVRYGEDLNSNSW
jgi:hypothetical protein